MAKSKNHSAVENYCCPKCRNRKAVSREAVISKSGLADLLPVRGGSRYLVITCSLCGYTELYDLAVMAHVAAPLAARDARAAAEEAQARPESV